MGGTDVKLAIFSCDKSWGDKTMKLKTLIFMSAVALASTSIVRAETVDQIGTFAPTTFNTFQSALSQHDLGTISPPSVRNFAIVYDDFIFNTSGVIDSFSWVGAYELNTPGTIPVGGPNFQVNFYTSLGTNAASAIPVASFNLTPVNTNEVALGGANSGFFSYTTSGVTPFNVSAGTTYFASVIAQLDYGINGWGLALSNLGNSFSIRDFQADGDLDVLRQPSDAIDYAFRITAVPEPGSVAAILAVAGLVAFRRRRMAKKLCLIGE